MSGSLAKKIPRHQSVTSPTDLQSLRVEEFLATKALSPNSQRAYRRELLAFLTIVNKPFAFIQSRHIVQYKVQLTEKLAPSSVNRALSAISSFFDWLEQAYGNPNPTLTIRQHKLPLPPAQDLTEAELEALLTALENRPSLTIIRDKAVFTALRHGLRAGEVASLNLSDYDGIRLHIQIAKDDSSGHVPLDTAGRDAINAYLKQRLQNGETFNPTAPLFLSHSPIPNAPRRFGYQGIYYFIKELGEMAGVANLTPHRLRHTFATQLLLTGMEPLHARTLTRHKSEVSFKRYAKRALEAAAERAFYQAIGEEPPTL